jgi:DNA repair protein RecN (Recombination protein N)
MTGDDSRHPAGDGPAPMILEELHVRDLALIEEAWLELGPGMTVLTGETGAGKTVLVGALKLLLGERADATLVRAGAAEALVEGRFGGAGEGAGGAGAGEGAGAGDPIERTARRRVSADGRSRCYLDGEMATVGALADELGPLVDLHGQHDHQELLRVASHAELLDRFAGAAPLLAVYRAAFRAHTEAAAALARLQAALGDRERRVFALQALVDEIDRVAPEMGEDDAIAARLPRLRHGEKLAAASSAAYRAITDEAGAAERLGEAAGALARVAGIDPVLDGIAEHVADLDERLGAAAAQLRDYGEGVDYDPVALEEAEARAAALAVLKRSHGPALSDVIEAREAAATELEQLGEGDAGLTAARAGVAGADATLVTAADALSAARAAASASFEERLADAARDLAMPHARFEASRAALPRESWTADGPERVEFLYAPATGEPARPLARIASGGEVSRVMLALKSVLGDADTVPVLVFDEIDAGIGGATALAVGRRLRNLAAGRQVLVVTHLAQVAAFADAQLVVEKSEDGGRVHTAVHTVTGDDRIAEIARMLSGSTSETSLAHARELLGSAAGGTGATTAPVTAAGPGPAAV